MSLKSRLELYDKIKEHRKHPLIVYVTSKRHGIESSMASDAIPYLIDQIQKIPKDTKHLDFLIVSYGGDPMVAWRIMSLLRSAVDNVSVLVPQSAYSAATLIALGASEIIMHPYGHLGPVDMQIQTVGERGMRHFSTEDISAFIEFVREQLSITDQEHLRKLFEPTLREVGALGLGFTARGAKLAIALGEKLLRMHRPKEEAAVSKTVVEKLSRQFHFHGYPVSRKEALEIGLQVNEKRCTVLEDLMWELWLDLESELKEREPFSPLSELMNSPAAAELLSPVPQLTLPGNAPSPNHLSSDIPALMTATKDVQPVDTQFVTALIESKRLCHNSEVKGKILAYRQPDLLIRHNVIISSKSWNVTHESKGA